MFFIKIGKQVHRDEKLVDANDKYLKELLKRIKKEGELVQTMPKGAGFLNDTRTQYRKNLGAVAVKNIFGGVTNVYVAYEDFDGSLKYYDYPQYSRRDVKKMRKEYENNMSL